MNLLKIGDRYINLDHVTDVEDRGHGLDVTLISLSLESASPSARTLGFNGAEGDALRRWLDRVAIDIIAT